MEKNESPSSEALDHAEISNLMKANTSDSVMVPRELLEKMYLNPPTTVSGDLRKRFGNPTPLAAAGLAISAFVVGCDFMGWRGAGGQGASGIPVYIFLGGVIQILGALLEWVLGNTFIFIIYGTLGGFFLSFGCIQIPSFGATAAYGEGDPIKGGMSPAFLASNAYFPLFMAVLSLTFLVGAVRTNMVFVIGLFVLTLAFIFVTAVYFLMAEQTDPQALQMALRMQHGAGALSFVLAIIAWYLFTALTLASVDFPIELPVGDLSWMPSATSRRAARQAKTHGA